MFVKVYACAAVQEVCSKVLLSMYGICLMGKYLYICMVHTVVLSQSLVGVFCSSQHVNLLSRTYYIQWVLGLRTPLFTNNSVYEQIFWAKNASGYERCLGLGTQSGNSGKLRVSARESVAGEFWLSARRCLNVPCFLLNFIVFCVVF
jgi:hypothetical protein